jgi:PAS domain S-box-containing protein
MIAKSKKAEEALTASVVKYSALFNSMDEGYFVIDVILNKKNQPVDLFYVEANSASVKIVGSDYTGKRLSEISPNYEKYWFDIFGDVALTGKSVRSERYAEPDKRWYSFYAFKIGGKDSRRIGNIFLDITERKKAEEALLNSEKQKNDILESITDGFVAFDREWRYTYVNSNAARILHTPKEKLLGKVAIDVFPNASKFLADFKRAVSSGNPIHFEEYYPEPLNVWYECHCYPSQNGLTVFFSDITQRKKAEEALKESEKQ